MNPSNLGVGNPSPFRHPLTRSLSSTPPAMPRSALRLDEGYSGGSEETTSPDSDANMQIDLDLDAEKTRRPVNSETVLSHLLALPASERASIAAALILGLPDTEKSGICYLCPSYSTSTRSNLPHRYCILGNALSAHLLCRCDCRSPQPSASQGSRHDSTAGNDCTCFPPPFACGLAKVFNCLEVVAGADSGQ